jgi:hypothetical protein
MRFNNATKDEQARRNSAKQGQSYNQTNETKRRWRARERRDEAFAKSLGMDLTYAGMGR